MLNDNWFLIEPRLEKPIDPQYLLWLKIRYILIGRNFEHYDSQKALELARQCSWPEAKWLVSICDKNGGIPSDKEEVKTMFLEEKDNALALILAGCILGYDWRLIKHAAQMGNSFAQAIFGYVSQDFNEGVLSLTELSIMQDEPEGWSYLGDCYKGGRIFLKDMSKAKKCFGRAIKLGYVKSLCEYGLMFNNDKSEHYVWLAEYALAGGCIEKFCTGMSIQMKQYYENPNKPIIPIIFKIGKLLEGHINVGLFQATSTGKLFLTINALWIQLG